MRTCSLPRLPLIRRGWFVRASLDLLQQYACTTWMKFASLWWPVVTYDTIVIREGKPDLGSRSCAAAVRNTESWLSGSESMPFVLHYSVQSNTASGIRVSRRATPSIAVRVQRACVQYTPLKARTFCPEALSAILLVNRPAEFCSARS